jgi:hypothetical protein
MSQLESGKVFVALELFDKLGRLDLSQLDEDAVASLTPEQQQCLSLLIDATAARQAAEERKLFATRRVRAAMEAETAAIEADAKANPAPSQLESHRASIAAFNANNKR